MLINVDHFQMTNQLILACKAYLAVKDTRNIWHDEKLSVISRMKVITISYCSIKRLLQFLKFFKYCFFQDCIKLCEQYYNCYTEMCRKVNDFPGGEPLELSEMYVFQKFNKFKKRMYKVSFPYLHSCISISNVHITYAIA